MQFSCNEPPLACGVTASTAVDACIMQPLLWMDAQVCMPRRHSSLNPDSCASACIPTAAIHMCSQHCTATVHVAAR